MPLYEYECTQCHRRLEKIQRFSDAQETICPHCGGALERVITAPAIQFKGAGWYVNDYAKSGAKSPATNSSEAKSSDAGKSDSSKDSGKSESSKDSGGSAAVSGSASSDTSSASTSSGTSSSTPASSGSSSSSGSTGSSGSTS